MLILWIMDLALVVLQWFLGLFDSLPPLTLPDGLDLVVPVPFIGAGGVSGLNVWVAAAVAVSCALVLGKVLQWLYSLIPYKAT